MTLKGVMTPKKLAKLDQKLEFIDEWWLVDGWLVVNLGAYITWYVEDYHHPWTGSPKLLLKPVQWNDAGFWTQLIRKLFAGLFEVHIKY